MIARADVVAEARRWIDTPFHHQARERGIACDCGGMVGGVAVACGVVAPDWWPSVFDPAFGGYSRRPSKGTLRRVLQTFATEIPLEDIAPADIVLMRFKREPQHVAIVADYHAGGLSIVHALSTVGRVVEHRLDSSWRRCLVAAFAMPGVR